VSEEWLKGLKISAAQTSNENKAECA